MAAAAGDDTSIASLTHSPNILPAHIYISRLSNPIFISIYIAVPSYCSPPSLASCCSFIYLYIYIIMHLRTFTYIFIHFFLTLSTDNQSPSAHLSPKAYSLVITRFDMPPHSLCLSFTLLPLPTSINHSRSLYSLTHSIFPSPSNPFSLSISLPNPPSLSICLSLYLPM